jgi:S-(hydroxymethyl)glutathione dehydrogenase/alcohol dehydrogenase
MRCRGAVIKQTPGRYEIVDLDVDDPRQDEIRVRLAGLCHSDDHVATGDLPVGIYPFAGGHEGAGIVESVGPNTTTFAAGDKIVFSFVPACGKCRWCATGHQNLCDLGANSLLGARWDDRDSFRMHLPDGTPVGQMAGVSAFSEYSTISVHSAVKVPADTDLTVACLLGCCVGTGWGAAVHTGQVGAGDTVIVMGVGGVGASAVQGAAHAGALNVIAVDPVAFKRDSALRLGATHTAATMREASALAKSFTNGQGADVAIVTVGVLEGRDVGQAFAAIRKRGTVVVSAVGTMTNVGVPIPLGELTFYEKQIKGSLYGSCNPNSDVSLHLELYRAGRLKLAELITNTYRLEDLATGFDDLHAGKNIRGVVVFDEAP